jgi:predicted small metal-binding protein
MKTMTCSQMGGPCDAAITADSAEEAATMGWKHMEEAHPEDAEKMKDMPQEEKDKWMAEHNEKWAALPEDAASETHEAHEVVAEETPEEAA